MTAPEQDRLAEIKQRAENTTPGPWVLQPVAADDDGLGEQWIHNSEQGAKEYAVAVTFFANPRLQEDAEFIAHSRADVEWLIGEVERLRSECSKLADYWDSQAADDHSDYDRFIVSDDEGIRMEARRRQGKAENYDAAARALRNALALPAKDSAR